MAHHSTFTLCIVLLSTYSVTFGDDTTFTASDIDILRMVTLNKIDSFANIDDGPEAKPLIASIVRLVFHDCIGPFNTGDTASTIDDSIRICDGCIDLDAVDHRGLQEFAVEPVEEICDPFKHKLNRADCWAAVGTIALEYAASLSTTPGQLPSIPYFTGRQECGLSPDAIILSSTKFPSPHLGWDPMFDFFEQFFDFDVQESAAIMGAHTLGRAHKTGSGFDGKWTLDPWALNNQFFIELLDKSNEWDQITDRSTGSPQWSNRGRTPDEEELVMLNVDIGIIADFEDHEEGEIGPPFIDNTTGIVSCRWEDFILYDAPLCPRERSFGAALQYAIDNQRFLRDFGIVWERLITNNYHDLHEITANEFRDVREDDDEITLYPTSAPAVASLSPTTKPTTTPTIARITAGPTTTSTQNGDTSFCCIAKKMPNWNGRCWGKLNERDCFEAAPGNGSRCKWDAANCRQTQTCSVRDEECTQHNECCSEICIRGIKKCR